MAQYVKLRGNLTETEVQKYSAQILSGLDYLHKNNIIHRDIKGLISTKMVKNFRFKKKVLLFEIMEKRFKHASRSIEIKCKII